MNLVQALSCDLDETLLDRSRFHASIVRTCQKIAARQRRLDMQVKMGYPNDAWVCRFGGLGTTGLKTLRWGWKSSVPTAARWGNQPTSIVSIRMHVQLCAVQRCRVQLQACREHSR
jgi:hypothetical protein